MNEADTRAEQVDPKLQVAGWISGDGVHVLREYVIGDGEIRSDGTRARKKFADYVLRYNGVNLAVVEAKSDEVPVSEGVAQAKLYAEKLGVDTSFATNGKDIYQICHKTGKEGKVDTFPSPQELWNKSFGEGSKADEWLKRFNAIPYEKGQGKKIRYYQEIAVQQVIRAIADNRQRILLTLATGTGKTYIAFQSFGNCSKAAGTDKGTVGDGHGCCFLPTAISWRIRHYCRLRHSAALWCASTREKSEAKGKCRQIGTSFSQFIRPS